MKVVLRSPISLITPSMSQYIHCGLWSDSGNAPKVAIIDLYRPFGPAVVPIRSQRCPLGHRKTCRMHVV